MQSIAENPLVSIIIPTYNRREYLVEAVQSCIAQTYRPIECIIVDDGSTDGTQEVVEEIKNQHISSFTINYIYQENAGSQVARNTGTKASQGEFIQYLDSDDLLYPEKIEKQVCFLKSNPNVDGVYGDWEKGTYQKKDFIKAWDGEDMLTQLLTERNVVIFAFLMRRSIINKIGEWDTGIKRNQEIDFQLRGLLEGAEYKYLSNKCGFWRIHSSERIANTTGSKEIFDFYNKWENRLIQKGLFNSKMGVKISNIYQWLAWENAKLSTGQQTSINFLEEAFRLNPQIPFANSKK